MEIKKVVQIADIQFRNYQRLNEFRGVCERFLYDMEHIVKPDRIAIIGDIVHSKNQISPELVKIVSWFLKGCADIAETVMIMGNHDFLENNQDRLDTLTPIVDSLNHPNLKYYKNSGVHSDENVNWVVYSLYDGNRRPVDMDKTPDPDKTYIGLYHGIIDGMVGYKNYAFETGAGKSTFSGCDIVLCGDIHLRQVKEQGGINLIMVGSLVQQGYGENIGKHGYCIINVPDLTYEFVDIENPVKHMVFKVTDHADIFHGKEILMNS